MSQLSLDTLFAEPKPISIRELTAQIKQLLERQFASVWVEGEISNLVKHSSGHWYFTLKDESAQIAAACFRMQNRYVRFAPENGMKVHARGRISVYEPRGNYQLIVETLEPVGIGALQLAFEQLKRKLEAEGLFEASRKRPLPLFPKKVGIVTSPTGAAIRDMLRVLKRRNQGIDVLLCPVKVQGEGAAQEIARAIELLNRFEDIDVLIVGRGGGSLEDLWAFNEEVVARAIAASRIPVISAVGHEIDFTIADFVADLRAPTPSAAAEQVAAAREELQARVRGLTAEMTRAVHFRILTARTRVAELTGSRGLTDVVNRIHRLSQRADEAVYRLGELVRGCLRRAREREVMVARRLTAATLLPKLAQSRGRMELFSERLIALTTAVVERSRTRWAEKASVLESLSPLAVLTRGYSIARKLTGQIVKRPADVSVGETLRVTLAEGEIQCAVAENK